MGASGGRSEIEMTTVYSEVLVAHHLNLAEELILALLNEESGYFHQVPGWNLNCAIVGAALAELSLMGRVDTDTESLYLVDGSETGNNTLDPILKEIADDPVQRNAQYWIERLAPMAEHIIDRTLDRLVALKILEHHDGDFWTFSPYATSPGAGEELRDGNTTEFVKTRLNRVIFNNEIPEPRDVIIICLIDTCDVFRFMFQMDEAAEERIRFICQMDLIGRSIAEAVSQHLAGPLVRHSALTRHIPRVSLRDVALHPHAAAGNVPALFAYLAEKYGPVFEVKPPFGKPMVFLAGPETNHWANRNGRMYLRARNYFTDFEGVYGASGVLPSLDGGEHFRLRKALAPAYSRGRLTGQIDQIYHQARAFMSDWKEGDIFSATRLCRFMINGQLSPLFVGVDSQDLVGELIKYKERALNTHMLKVLPKFLLRTPGMRKRAKAIDELLERIQSVHTPTQRAGAPRDLADDLLSLHASDPQLVPESNLRFALSAALIASVYLGDAYSFALYAMASQPEIYGRIQEEADALFANGDPGPEDLSPTAMEVTHRFLMECLRMYPIVPMSIRDVMNSCVVEDYQLDVGTRVYIAQTAAHYMEEVFPEPYKFDIDRYLPPRNEHHHPGYAPYGLGPHRCLGSGWMELQLAMNVLMVAHYFNIKVHPANHRLKFSPLPSPKPSKKLKFLVAKRRHELPG